MTEYQQFKPEDDDGEYRIDPESPTIGCPDVRMVQLPRIRVTCNEAQLVLTPTRIEALQRVITLVAHIGKLHNIIENGFAISGIDLWQNPNEPEILTLYHLASCSRVIGGYSIFNRAFYSSTREVTSDTPATQKLRYTAPKHAVICSTFWIKSGGVITQIEQQIHPTWITDPHDQLQAVRENQILTRLHYKEKPSALKSGLAIGPIQHEYPVVVHISRVPIHTGNPADCFLYHRPDNALPVTLSQWEQMPVEEQKNWIAKNLPDHYAILALVRDIENGRFY